MHLERSEVLRGDINRGPDLGFNREPAQRRQVRHSETFDAFQNGRADVLTRQREAARIW